MKNLKLFLGVLMFCSFYCNSQVSEGKILYNVNIDIFMERINSNNSNSSANTLFKDVAKAIKDVSMTLSFNQHLSKFEVNKTMPSDFSEKTSKLALIMANKGVYYTNKKLGKQLLVRTFQGDNFNVLSEIEERNWTLTRESKKIGDFTCYKATMNKETVGGNFPITAWYTPQIPLSFGPNQFVGNLPGLILELHDTDVSYVCSTITLNPKENLVIEWPEADETMTKEEYKKTGDKLKKKLTKF